MSPNVNAGTHRNCIQYQLIWFFKKSRWAENPCWRTDWWTGLLCLVRLLLIFHLLLLLLPLPLHCGVQWKWGGCTGSSYNGCSELQQRLFPLVFQPVVWFSCCTAECSLQTPPEMKLNFLTLGHVFCSLDVLCRRWMLWQQSVWRWGSKWLSTRSSWPTWRPGARRWEGAKTYSCYVMKQEGFIARKMTGSVALRSDRSVGEMPGSVVTNTAVMTSVTLLRRRSQKRQQKHMWRGLKYKICN